MKGFWGLMVAGVLGILGAMVNYLYLAGKAKEIEMVSFIGIKKDVIVARGEKLRPENLVEVRIPKNACGNLKDYAFLWSAKSTVENVTAFRTLSNGSDGTLLMQSDVKTPPSELDLGPNEIGMEIPMENRSFVAALLSPGDRVMFKLLPAPRGSASARPAPRPTGAAAGGPPKSDDTEKSDSEKTEAEKTEPDKVDLTGVAPETLGPFRIAAIGNRLCTSEVMRTSKIPVMQENVLTIRVNKSVAGERELADKLWIRLHDTNFRQVGIELLPRQ
jgi:hypothetical protein